MKRNSAFGNYCSANFKASFLVPGEEEYDVCKCHLRKKKHPHENVRYGDKKPTTRDAYIRQGNEKGSRFTQLPMQTRKCFRIGKPHMGTMLPA